MPIWGDEIRERAEREYRLRIASVVSAETGNYPIRVQRPPRKIHFPSAERTRARGVYETEFPPTGYRAFNIVTSAGETAYVQFPAHWVTREFIQQLLRRLDKIDPPRPLLTVIPAGE